MFCLSCNICKRSAAFIALVACLIAAVQFFKPHETSWLKQFIDNNANKSYREIDDGLAQRLASEVRLVCWVMTHPDNHATKAAAVKATWGKRCNTLLFMSTAEDSSLNTIVLDVEEGREHLWEKSVQAFRYVYEHHLNESDWFVRADDDTYMIVENLRYMLHGYSPNDSLYFGCKFRYGDDIFMSGGAGFVLSRGALRAFIEQGIDKNICDQGYGGVDDVAMGVCMRKLNITFGDSTDEHKAQRFFPFPPQLHLIPEFYDVDNWYWQYRVDGTPDVRIDNCSQHVITFHYISPAEMRMFDYFLYDVNVYGRTRHSKPMVLSDGSN